MQIIQLSYIQLLILIFIISPLVELAAVLIGRKVPLTLLTADRWLYATRKWEKGGSIYRKYFKINKWKKYIPEGAKCFKDDFEKNKLISTDTEYLSLFIAELCRAELVHWLMLIPFVFYYLFTPFFVATSLLIIASLINIPCIMAQRYNRPRVQALLDYKLAQKKIIEDDESLAKLV